MSRKKWVNPTGYKNAEGKWRMLPSYNMWFDMVQRCKSDRSRAIRPTYEDVTLHPEWESYDVFCEW